MKKLSLLLIAALAVPNLAFAATDGTLGATSVGSVNVSLTTTEAPPSGIQVSGLEDISWVGIVPGDRAEQIVTSNVCVYSDVADTYTIAIESENSSEFIPPSGFDGVLVNFDNVSEQLNYTWRFSDAGTGHVTNSTPDAILTASGVENCSGTPNSTFRIRSINVPDTYSSNASFTDVITLTLTPQ